MVKNIFLALIALIVLAGGVYLFMNMNGETVTPEDDVVSEVETTIDTDTTPDEGGNDQDDTVEEPEPREVIGTSVEGTDIIAHHFGTGEDEVLVIGGIHSAFAPNTVAVVEELIDALEIGDMTVPEHITLTVIANLNPDASGGPNTRESRLNARDVDLNRNFDCGWKTDAVWRDQAVSGGEAACSEPEAAALRDYVEDHDIAAAVAYYAADGGVYAAHCNGTPDEMTATLTNAYATASGYTANNEFDAYAISGDMTNWLAKAGVPTISVLLSDYTSTEWGVNRAGIDALLTSLAE